MIRAGWDRWRLFTFGELIAHPARSALSTAVLALSCALLVAVLSMAGSVTGSVAALTDAIGGDASLEVTGVTESGFDQDLLREVSDVPGVRAAVPMLRTRIGPSDQRALLVGADARVAALGGDLDGALGGTGANLLTVPDGVVVGAALGRRPGERFPLGHTTVTVAGVLDDAASKDLNSGYIVLALLPVAQKIAGRAGSLDSIQIVTDPGADAARVRADLTAVVDGRAVVADPSLRALQASGSIRVVEYSTIMAAAAALVVSSFLVYNVMSMAVAQRRPVLSLLRAVGGRRNALVRDLIAEAVLIGMLGGVLGALLGVFLGRFAIDGIPTAMIAAAEVRPRYMVPPHAIPAGIVSCVLASVAATVLAARQVYRVEPVEALAPVAGSRVPPVGPVAKGFALAGGVVMLAGAVYLTYAGVGQLSVATIALSIAGAICLCFAGMRPMVRLAAATTGLCGSAGALGATTVHRAPRRVWATAMTVMIAVTATVAVGGASRNLVDSAADSFGALGGRDAYVSPATLAEFPTGPVLPAGLKDRLRAVPGVREVTSAQMAFATLGRDRVLLQAFEAGLPAVGVGELAPWVVRRMASGEGVVLSRDVADRLSADIGTLIDLPTPTGVHRVRVLAIVPYFSAVSGIVLLDLDILRDWFQRPGETILGLAFAPDADPAVVLEEIRRTVPPGLQVETGAGAVRAVTDGVRQGTALSGAILWIVVLVATAALLNTAMLSMLERRRELGVLRAMGAARGFLLRTVLAESAGIAVSGAAVGLVTGAVIQHLATTAMGQAMTLDVAYEPSPIQLGYALAALLLALAGSVPPALHAARLPVVEAIALD
ncbi:ABC transporter permease [Nocardia puris]|uniref:Putative ABC transport system permease protein n=1 Tax=Nocardia puris TaxID=208602 RepID=A0A366DHC9_9NOCA|nr:ABC transporter permease [Nocardia puris]MBF6213306.1 ABC transporter permease [Nocardia puris]MBF6369526.1 ABC transporter permease [Nocardia puris]MBF6462185.1 ABC transporter permease [Nocardia puris]RBO89492.1 putative ABC transport system permease protein [Nocardia puris]